MGGSEYERLKHGPQIELLKMRTWVKRHTGAGGGCAVEGRDVGRGGIIKRSTEHLNPRAARVVALGKPSDLERGQWYFQRYFALLPTVGEIVLCACSWYNRAVVERVMGFCAEAEYAEFIDDVPRLEHPLTETSIHLTKLWFSVSRADRQGWQ
jgi:polyphosphate kinase 2 (PPK2 family)